jgi:hypothetical protein
MWNLHIASPRRTTLPPYRIFAEVFQVPNYRSPMDALEVASEMLSNG